MKGDGNMAKKTMSKMVELKVQVPEEIAAGVAAMAGLKNLASESLIRLWIEDGLEREELRFERLLLFADVSGELDEASVQLLNRLKTNYFDEASDGQRGLDSYLVKSTNMNGLYRASSGKVSAFTMR